MGSGGAGGGRATVPGLMLRSSLRASAVEAGAVTCYTSSRALRSVWVDSVACFFPSDSLMVSVQNW